MYIYIYRLEDPRNGANVYLKSSYRLLIDPLSNLRIMTAGNLKTSTKHRSQACIGSLGKLQLIFVWREFSRSGCIYPLPAAPVLMFLPVVSCNGGPQIINQGRNLKNYQWSQVHLVLQKIRSKSKTKTLPKNYSTSILWFHVTISVMIFGTLIWVDTHLLSLAIPRFNCANWARTVGHGYQCQQFLACRTQQDV